MENSTYCKIVRILAKAQAPMSTREVFNQLDAPGATAHDVSKALNNLKTVGRVSSVKDPAVGRAHRWSIVERTSSRKTRTPVFRFTDAGALVIASDSVVAVIPRSLVSRLRAFLDDHPYTAGKHSQRKQARRR